MPVLFDSGAGAVLYDSDLQKVLFESSNPCDQFWDFVLHDVSVSCGCLQFDGSAGHSSITATDTGHINDIQIPLFGAGWREWVCECEFINESASDLYTHVEISSFATDCSSPDVTGDAGPFIYAGYDAGMWWLASFFTLEGTTFSFFFGWGTDPSNIPNQITCAGEPGIDLSPPACYGTPWGAITHFIGIGTGGYATLIDVGP